MLLPNPIPLQHNCTVGESALACYCLSWRPGRRRRRRQATHKFVAKRTLLVNEENVRMRVWEDLRSFIQNLYNFAKRAFAQTRENLISVLDDVSLLVNQVTVFVVLSGDTRLRVDGRSAQGLAIARHRVRKEGRLRLRRRRRTANKSWRETVLCAHVS